MKTWNKKLLSAAVTGCMTFLTCSSLPLTFASDIEIYREATVGQPRILLMLDTSGSMGISSLVLPRNNPYGSPGDVDPYVSEDKALCKKESVNELYENSTSQTKPIKQWLYNAIDNRGNKENNPTYGKPSFLKIVSVNGEQIPYYLRGCGNATIDADGNLVESDKGKFDRLSRLKDAVIQLLASESLDSNVQIGLGHFSAGTGIQIGTTDHKLIDGHSGKILVPVANLDAAQRVKIIRQLAAIQSVDTKTLENGDESLNLRLTSTRKPLADKDIFKASSGTPTAHAYAEAGAYMMGTTTGQATEHKNVKLLYDGAAVITNMDTGDQINYVCVGVDGEYGNALGAISVFCDNEWNRGMDKTGQFYDSSNKRPGDLVKIFKPNPIAGTGDDWIPVTPQEFKTQFGAKNSVWAIHNALPVGWRWGGWMKVQHQPMDIEPIGAKVWSHHPNNSPVLSNMVSYRASPFAVASTESKDTSGKTIHVPIDNMKGGFSYSVAESKKDGKYIAGGSTSQCDGNGIYFLTDGAPNSTKDNMAQAIMNETLGDKGFAYKPIGNVLVSPKLQASVFESEGETGGWEYIGEYAKKLKDPMQNPGNMSIKTAVVGFGSSFEGISKNADGSYNCNEVENTNIDAYNACKWGGEQYGDGGFYYAENSDDIVRSIIDFVKKVEVETESVVTGAPTLPVDSLNPTAMQSYAFYASFQPTVSSTNQLWIGNLNKYNIINGALFSEDGSEPLIKTDGTLNTTVQGFWTGGALGQLQIGANFLEDGKTTTHRKIFTNRSVTDSIASSGKELNVVDVDALFDGDYSTDADKIYWLNALGFNIDETQTSVTKETLNAYATDKRLGAVMHSTPVLLTQEGKVEVKNNVLTTDNRKDYLMYGSTQGILHVVDASTGKEVFGFLPHEMLLSQKKALLLKDKTAGGMPSLFYGIDGAWTAHTQYVTKSDGTLTVGNSGRLAGEEKEEEAEDTTGDLSTKNNLQGKQWVYGGLRMGGKSYYGLDLSDLSNPNLMLHIDPSATDAKAELKRMGQSWSKPTIGYVNWAGKSKLVMFVGGGYDAQGEVDCTSDSTKTNKGYECPTYHQTNKVGAGVYMFDAENGDLLWWSSSDKPTGFDPKISFTQNQDLQYSVASQINAIDRNGDGLLDHLYFGDLAGQAFRVDLNNALAVSAESDNESQDVVAAKNNFGTRVVTLFSENKDSTDGLKPRFYEMPSVSIHTDNTSGSRFAVVSLSSGNRSSPLTENSPNDGVFAAFDKDVVNAQLFNSDYELQSQNLELQDLDLKTGSSFEVDGWRSYFSESEGSYKGMNDIYALDNMLYVNVYHKDGYGTSGQCGAGVRGDSYLFQYCLPYGKCDFYDEKVKEVNKVKIGVGILGTGLGKAYTNLSNQLGLIVNRPSTSHCLEPQNKNLPECQVFDNSARLKQLRWYEVQ